jgi:uracil-DNA glycosylase
VSEEVSAEAKRLEKLQVAKARAELRAADAQIGAKTAIAGRGDPTAEVMIVKGVPDAGEVASRSALSGEDGVAARKALAALGFDPERLWATHSRPAQAGGDDCAGRLEAIVEAVDPLVAIALDDVAATDLAAAYRVPALVPGRPVIARGRVLGCVGGLAASLSDPAAKARVWECFKTIAAAVPGTRAVAGTHSAPRARAAAGAAAVPRARVTPAQRKGASAAPGPPSDSESEEER